MSQKRSSATQLEWDYGEDWPLDKKWNVLPQNDLKEAAKLTDVYDYLIGRHRKEKKHRRSCHVSALLKPANGKIYLDEKACAEMAHNYQYHKIEPPDKEILKHLTTEVMSPPTRLSQFVYPLQLLKDSSDSSFSQAIPQTVAQYLDDQKPSKNAKRTRFVICHGAEKSPGDQRGNVQLAQDLGELCLQQGMRTAEQPSAYILVPCDRNRMVPRGRQDETDPGPAPRLHSARPIPLALSQLHSTCSPSSNKTCGKEYPQTLRKNTGENTAALDASRHNAVEFLSPQGSVRRTETTSTKQSTVLDFYSPQHCRLPLDWYSVSNADSFQDEADATDFQSVYSLETVLEGGEWNASAFPGYGGTHRGRRTIPGPYEGTNVLVERPVSTLSFVSIHSNELNLHIFGPEVNNSEAAVRPSKVVEKCERWLKGAPGVTSPQSRKTGERPLQLGIANFPRTPLTSRDTESESASGCTPRPTRQTYRFCESEVPVTWPHLKTYAMQGLVEQADKKLPQNLPVRKNSLVIIPVLPHVQNGRQPALDERDSSNRVPQGYRLVKDTEGRLYFCYEVPFHYGHLVAPGPSNVADGILDQVNEDDPMEVSFLDNTNQKFKLLPVNAHCDNSMKKAVQKLLLTEFLSIVPNSPECKNITESLEVIVHRTLSSENEIRAICSELEITSSAAEESAGGGADTPKKRPDKKKTDVMLDPIRTVKSLDSAKSSMTDDSQTRPPLAEPLRLIPLPPLKDMVQEISTFNCDSSGLKSNDSMIPMVGSLEEQAAAAGGNGERVIVPDCVIADKVVSTHSGPFSSPGQRHHLVPSFTGQLQCLDFPSEPMRKSAGAQVKLTSPKMGVDCCCQTCSARSDTRRTTPTCTCAQSCSCTCKESCTCAQTRTCTCRKSCTCAKLLKTCPKVGVDCYCQTSARTISPVLRFASDHDSVCMSAFKSCVQVSAQSSEECFIEPKEDCYHDAIDSCARVTCKGYPTCAASYQNNVSCHPCHQPESRKNPMRPTGNVFIPRIPVPIHDCTDQSYQPAGCQPYPDCPVPSWNGMYYSPIALQLPAELIAAITAKPQKDTPTTCQTTQTGYHSPRSGRKQRVTWPKAENDADGKLNDLSLSRKNGNDLEKFQDKVMLPSFPDKNSEKLTCLSMNVQKGGEWSVFKNAPPVEPTVNQKQPASILRTEPQAPPATSCVTSLSPKWVDEYDKLQQQKKASNAMISRGNQCDEECLRSMGNPENPEAKPDVSTASVQTASANGKNSGKRNQTPVLRLVFASSDESDVGDTPYIVKSNKSKKRSIKKPASASSNYITVDEGSPIVMDNRDEFLQMLLKLYKELSVKGRQQNCVQSSTTDTSIANYKLQKETKRKNDSSHSHHLRQSSGGDWNRDCCRISQCKTNFSLDGAGSHRNQAGLESKPFAQSRSMAFAPSERFGMFNRMSQDVHRSNVKAASAGPKTAPPPPSFPRAKVYPRSSFSWGGLETLLERLTPMKRAEEMNGDGTYRPKTAPTRPRCCYTGNSNVRGNSCYTHKAGCNHNCGEICGGGFTTESTNTATSDISFYCQHQSKLPEAAGDDNIICYGKRHRNNKQNVYNLTQ